MDFIYVYTIYVYSMKPQTNPQDLPIWPVSASFAAAAEQCSSPHVVAVFPPLLLLLQLQHTPSATVSYLGG